MRVLTARLLTRGHLALTCAAAVALLAPRWPLLLLVLPAPALLTGRLAEDPRPAAAVCAAGAVAGAGWLALGERPLGLWVTGAVLVLFTVLLPWLVGLYLRSTAALEAAGWERARTLEREALLVAERARMRERSRIAQDLHDAVGHELSLLSLHAGALEMAAEPGGRREEISRLRETAGRAAERLTEAVGVLRSDAGPAPLAPHGDGVAALVERARASGMDVTLEREDGRPALPVMVDRAVHRVVQESLTNAARHAPGSAVRVVVGGSADEATVLVADTAPPGQPGRGAAPRASRADDALRPEGAAAVRAPGGGTGLVGLRERVRLVGGVFEAGPDGNGWAVSARIPARGPGAELGGDRPRHGGAPTDSRSGVPGSPESHRRARRRARRAIGCAVGLPVALVLAGYGLTVALTAHQAATATLEPSVFERLRPGQDRAEVEALLPEGDLYEGPFWEYGRPAAPEGLECADYRSSADVFGGGYDRYRLCFDAGVLVSAEVAGD
ncbi:histidine kinase [Nocardiopsis sp. CT-R113]|uniref:histidine kinase n=1 Tax=Nocardiopsis codii TaxID=3065942 RepID=A0ABU7K9T1_9ACTN|nr:histidine kinase [Nocardiopsis sp. CT-R113]MEE2038998.1 histidine kinase [Nocardiopsis sp. CT-R113]